MNESKRAATYPERLTSLERYRSPGALDQRHPLRPIGIAPGAALYFPEGAKQPSDNHAPGDENTGAFNGKSPAAFAGPLPRTERVVMAVTLANARRWACTGVTTHTGGCSKSAMQKR